MENYSGTDCDLDHNLIRTKLNQRLKKRTKQGIKRKETVTTSLILRTISRLDILSSGNYFTKFYVDLAKKG